MNENKNQKIFSDYFRFIIFAAIIIAIVIAGRSWVKRPGNYSAGIASPKASVKLPDLLIPQTRITVKGGQIEFSQARSELPSRVRAARLFISPDRRELLMENIPFAGGLGKNFLMYTFASRRWDELASGRALELFERWRQSGAPVLVDGGKLIAENIAVMFTAITLPEAAKNGVFGDVWFFPDGRRVLIAVNQAVEIEDYVSSAGSAEGDDSVRQDRIVRAAVDTIGQQENSQIDFSVDNATGAVSLALDGAGISGRDKGGTEFLPRDTGVYRERYFLYSPQESWRKLSPRERFSVLRDWNSGVSNFAGMILITPDTYVDDVVGSPDGKGVLLMLNVTAGGGLKTRQFILYSREDNVLFGITEEIGYAILKKWKL